MCLLFSNSGLSLGLAGRMLRVKASFLPSLFVYHLHSSTRSLSFSLIIHLYRDTLHLSPLFMDTDQQDRAEQVRNARKKARPSPYMSAEESKRVRLTF